MKLKEALLLELSDSVKSFYGKELGSILREDPMHKQVAISVMRYTT